MLAATLTFALALAAPQGPHDAPGTDLPRWVTTGAAPEQPGAIVVSGQVELRAGEADRAAMVRAGEELRWDLERDARAVVEQRRPLWMPDLVAERITDRWLNSLQADEMLQIVDRRRVEHDHGDYQSFQTWLLVAHDEPRIEASLDTLAHRVDGAATRLRWQGLGTLGFWGVLGLAWLWLDRLTRGYMTWRLAALFGGMAVALPGSAMLLI